MTRVAKRRHSWPAALAPGDAGEDCAASCSPHLPSRCADVRHPPDRGLAATAHVLDHFKEPGCALIISDVLRRAGGPVEAQQAAGFQQPSGRPGRPTLLGHVGDDAREVEHLRHQVVARSIGLGGNCCGGQVGQPGHHHAPTGSKPLAAVGCKCAILLGTVGRGVSCGVCGDASCVKAGQAGALLTRSNPVLWGRALSRCAPRTSPAASSCASGSHIGAASPSATPSGAPAPGPAEHGRGDSSPTTQPRGSPLPGPDPSPRGVHAIPMLLPSSAAAARPPSGPGPGVQRPPRAKLTLARVIRCVDKYVARSHGCGCWFTLDGAGRASENGPPPPAALL